MNEVPNEGDFGEENEVPRGRTKSARRRSPTPARESTPERRFNELISAIHSMTGTITTMQKQLNTVHRHVGGQEAPERHMSPPRPDEGEEPWVDKAKRELSLRRSRSLRGKRSTHHGSLDHPEPTFLKSHSHRAPQGTNPLLGMFLDEDVGKIGEQPIIPKSSKPMFAKKSTNEAKNRFPDPLELNQIFKEYSMLDLGLRRDMNFNGYLEILGLKGSISHSTHFQSNSWGDKKDLQQKINKMQVPFYDGQKMTTRVGYISCRLTLP